MGRRGARHRDLVGLAVCALLAVLAIVRESLDTHAVLESILASYSTQTVPSSSSTMTTSPLVSLQDRDGPKAIDFHGIGSKNKNGTVRIAPRVVVLLPSFPMSPLPLVVEPQSTTILRSMSYPMESINSLYSDKYSSAGEMLRNQQQLSSQSIEFLGLGKDDGSSEAAAAATASSSVGKSKSKSNHPRIMEMPEAASMDMKDKVYRRFEREWYEDCVPVTTEHASRDNRKRKRKQKDNRESSTRIAQSTCNMFHELDVAEAYDSIPSGSNDDEKNNPAKTAGQRENHIELLGQGSWRSVWKLTTTGSMGRRSNSNSTTSEHALDDIEEETPGLVLKLLHTHHNYNEYSFSIHQADAMVMVALAESNYVVDSFGFCGQSVITEASVTSGRSLIKTKSLTSVDRLCIARDLARGLADLHALVPHLWEEQRSSSSNNSRVLHTRGKYDDDDNPFSHSLHPLVFAHHDVNPANLISAGDGRIKWNDFNLGLFNRRYPPPRRQPEHEEEIISNATECPVPVRYEQLLWRSPEECENRTGTLFLDTERTGKNTAAQAADVYSLGNILFYVLARHQPWSHLEEVENESQQQQHRGDEPPSHNNNHRNATVTAAKLDTGSSPEHRQASLRAISKAKVEGRLPNLPDRYLDRPGARILWEAVKMCYTHDPRLRPRAIEIAEFLGTAHSELLRREGKEKHNTTTTTKIETSSKRKTTHTTTSSDKNEKEE